MDRQSSSQSGSTASLMNLLRRPSLAAFRMLSKDKPSVDAMNKDGKVFENAYQRLRWARSKTATLDHLCITTGMQKAEIQQMYRTFKQAFPSGVVSREGMQEVLEAFFPRGNSRNYADLMFKAMDKDQNGTITFDEVLMAFAVSTRSSVYNRLLWIFKLYDADRDGILSRKDVILVIKSVYDLLGPCTPPVTPEAIEEHVEWLFQKLDLNKDGVIDMNEFIDACQDDPGISCGLEPSSLFNHSNSRIGLQQSESCAAESGSASNLSK